MIARPYGLILSTGPNGSGKSTSLYSIIKKINKAVQKVIQGITTFEEAASAVMN